MFVNMFSIELSRVCYRERSERRPGGALRRSHFHRRNQSSRPGCRVQFSKNCAIPIRTSCIRYQPTWYMSASKPGGMLKPVSPIFFSFLLHLHADELVLCGSESVSKRKINQTRQQWPRQPLKGRMLLQHSLQLNFTWRASNTNWRGVLCQADQFTI
jgi:hypothetical protein